MQVKVKICSANSVKIKLTLDLEEARILMSMMSVMQNPIRSFEGSVAADIRETLFVSLEKVGILPR